nr:hypothetical protein HEP87_54870 [Streptomyces sp. S1D4-11]
MGASIGPVVAATAPVSNPRVLIRYDLAAGEQPENIAAAPGGAFDVVLSRAAKVERITPQGGRQLLAALPVPEDGGVHTPALGYSIATGLVRTADGTLYIGYAAGHDHLTGIWQVRPGGTPKRVIALGADSFPNGMALDPRTQQIYFADSARGIIWRFPAKGGAPVKWASGAKLNPTGLYGLGANGLKIHENAVWTSNADQGTLLRIPIGRHGKPGAFETKLTGPHLDDFTFIGHSDAIVATLDPDNKVALIKPDGSYSIVMDEKDGLQGPTSAAVRHSQLYVLSAAFLTNTDPNIVVADIGVRDAVRN